jgi:hypothetical protein
MLEPCVLLVERGQLFEYASAFAEYDAAFRVDRPATRDRRTISCISFGRARRADRAFDLPLSTDLSPAPIDRSSRTNTVCFSPGGATSSTGPEVVAHRHDEIGILECVDSAP